MDAFEVFDKRFKRYILFNAGLERIAEGCRWTEGPVWFGDAGCLLFSDIPNNRILRWTEGVGVSVYRQPSQFANGHTRDQEGRLISCLHGARAVVRTEHDGRVTVLADRHEGQRLNSPNDVVVKSDGSIWFTDPHYGIAMDYEGELLGKIRLPQAVSNVTFGGRHRGRLFICATTEVYAIYLHRRGAPPP